MIFFFLTLREKVPSPVSHLTMRATLALKGRGDRLVTMIN
jgi:hypothetical protein